MLSGQPVQEALLRLSGASVARLPCCLTSQSAQLQDFYHYAVKINERGVATQQGDQLRQGVCRKMQELCGPACQVPKQRRPIAIRQCSMNSRYNRSSMLPLLSTYEQRVSVLLDDTSAHWFRSQSQFLWRKYVSGSNWLAYSSRHKWCPEYEAGLF